MDDQDKTRRIVGHVYLQAQLVGWVAFLWAIAFAVMGFEKPERATAAGLMMIASALAFGYLANAVLRR